MTTEITPEKIGRRMKKLRIGGVAASLTGGSGF
jgi:hypothetical protein